MKQDRILSKLRECSTFFVKKEAQKIIIRRMCQGNGEVTAAHPFCVIFILIISYLPKVMNEMYNNY